MCCDTIYGDEDNLKRQIKNPTFSVELSSRKNDLMTDYFFFDTRLSMYWQNAFDNWFGRQKSLGSRKDNPSMADVRYNKILVLQTKQI